MDVASCLKLTLARIYAAGDWFWGPAKARASLKRVTENGGSNELGLAQEATAVGDADIPHVAC